jgi:hypothetical protein
MVDAALLGYIRTRKIGQKRKKVASNMMETKISDMTFSVSNILTKKRVVIHKDDDFVTVPYGFQ